jgi:hypothetical protein
MSRQKAISVKIATVKVIAALEAALEKLELDYTTQAAREAEFDKSYDAWKEKLLKVALSKFSEASNLRTNYRSYNNMLNVDFDIYITEKDLPVMPERNFSTISKHEYNSSKEEMGNAIRILKMTDEEVVNTSTYNAVARYL